MSQRGTCEFRRRAIVAAVRRVVVGVSGSLGSLQALRLAADEARAREATLVAVIAWVPPGGDFAERSHPSPYLRQIWRDAAKQRLADAFDAGLGGLPGGVAAVGRVGRGGAGPGAGCRTTSPCWRGSTGASRARCSSTWQALPTTCW